MANLTLRLTKGSPLTHAELDANFEALNAGSFDSGLEVDGGIVVNSGDVDIVDGDLILRNGDILYNPKLGFYDLVSASERMRIDSNGSLLVGSSTNDHNANLKVTRVGDNTIVLGNKTSNSGQNTFLKLGNAGEVDRGTTGIRATQMSSDSEDWTLSLVGYNSTDGYVSALEVDNTVAVNIKVPLIVEDSAHFLNGLDITGDLIVNGSPIGGGSGSVTSVGVSAPTGFTVSNSPITSSGTVALTYDAAYSLGLPSNAKQGNWDTAFGWGDHSTAGYVSDAPSDGSYYSRRNGAWQVAAGGVALTDFSVTTVAPSGDGSLSYDNTTGTFTFAGADYLAGSGISVSAGNVITNTAPDQTVSITGTRGTTITGTYPSFNIDPTRLAAGGGTAFTTGGSNHTFSAVNNTSNALAAKLEHQATGSGTGGALEAIVNNTSNDYVQFAFAGTGNTKGAIGPIDGGNGTGSHVIFDATFGDSANGAGAGGLFRGGRLQLRGHGAFGPDPGASNAEDHAIEASVRDKSCVLAGIDGPKTRTGSRAVYEAKTNNHRDWWLWCSFGGYGQHRGGVRPTQDGTAVAFEAGAGGAFLTTSDSSVKEDIVSLTGATALVEAMRPVRFHYKPDVLELDSALDSDASATDSASYHVGFLAGQLQQVFPRAVVDGAREYDAGTDSLGNAREWAKSVDLTKLVPVLTRALQETLTRIDTIETRLDSAGV